MKLIGLVSEGKIKSIVDNGRKVQPEGFKGLDSVSDAIQVCHVLCHTVFEIYIDSIQDIKFTITHQYSNLNL